LVVYDLNRAGWETGAPLADAILYKGEEDLFRRPEFHAGEFEIQDIASQAVGWLCAPQPGETWWDACAGEGGKTLHLSALMENRGLIWASDRAEWRLKNLKRRAARAQVFNFRAASWDGGSKLPTKTKFDGVLVDAPCSGVGTWQRNPHARWTTTLPDVRELAAVQKRLLANVAGSVKPGGKLIYAVCTLTRAETTEVAADFSGRFPNFEPLPLWESGATRFIWPQDLGGNGMFIAGWRRRV
jgi:16S rRNA (cytosine967-C5)-methyltransferase